MNKTVVSFTLSQVYQKSWIKFINVFKKGG
jgi:hypothetical protein